MTVQGSKTYRTIGLNISAQATCSFDAVNTLTLATMRVGVALAGRRGALGPSCGEGKDIHRIKTTGRLSPYLETNSTSWAIK